MSVRHQANPARHLSAHGCSKNTKPLKDVEETTSLTSSLLFMRCSYKVLVETNPLQAPRSQFLSTGQVWPDKRPLVQFPHLTPTPAACSCLLLWSDTMYVFQLLHPSRKQQLSLFCFGTYENFFFLLLAFIEIPPSGDVHS